MPITKMTDCDLAGKRVLIREDFNVPMHNGKVSNDARLRAALPTIQYALQQGAAILLISHLGRPKEGEFDAEYSLAPVATQLSQLLKKPVKFVSEWLDGVNIAPGDIVLCENLRFNVGEKANDKILAQKMAALCDVFVMDAFGTAHRAHASTHGVAQYAKLACAGPLLIAELDALAKAMQQPQKPIVAIVGGSKVSTKLSVLDSLITFADYVIVGGGIANTFIAAQGHDVGNSLVEMDLIPEAQRLLALAKEKGCQIPLPTDVLTAKEFSEQATAVTSAVEAVKPDDMILDIGPETAATFAGIMQQAKTIVWNGPVGVFEFDNFAHGTKALALAIADSSAFSIAGGGDTLAAIDTFSISDKISYISTGGGAFLEFLEGKTLPAVEILEAV